MPWPAAVEAARWPRSRASVEAVGGRGPASRAAVGRARRRVGDAVAFAHRGQALEPEGELLGLVWCDLLDAVLDELPEQRLGRPRVIGGPWAAVPARASAAKSRRLAAAAGVALGAAAGHQLERREGAVGRRRRRRRTPRTSSAGSCGVGQRGPENAFRRGARVSDAGPVAGGGRDACTSSRVADGRERRRRPRGSCGDRSRPRRRRSAQPVRGCSSCSSTEPL